MTERRMVGAKRLLVLLGCCAALGGTVYFVHGFQLRRNASGLLDRARQAEEEGQNTQALDYVSQYIGLVPSDTDALARLGRLLDKSARTVKEKEKAYFVLDQVLRRDPERHDVRRDVVRLATELQRFDDARFHLERLVKDLPPDAELFGLTGRCDAAAHKYNDAAKAYARAVELDVTRVDLAAEYAALLRDRLDMPEVADAVVRDLLTANERSLPARLVAARHFLSGGVPDRAEDHVRYALDELGADDAETLALAAAVSVARGKPDEARRRLERGLELHADDSRLRQDLARLEGRSGRRDRALELLRPLLKDLPDSPSELWERGNLLIDLENETGVEAVLLKLQKGGPAWAVVILRARLSILHEAWGDARLALERLRNDKLLPKLVDLQAHLLLADCYAALGNPDEQALACRQALEIEPTSLPALIRLAGALVALHKPDAAIELYRKLARQVPEVRLEVVRLLVEKVLTLPASKARHWDEVEKAFADLSDGQRNSATGFLLRADVLAAQDKLAEAHAEAVKARDADPKAPAPWLYLMELDRRHDKSANVLSLLTEAEKQVGKRLEWDLVRARHWAAVGGDEGARRLKEIAGTIRVPTQAQARVLLPLAVVYLMANDAATAKRLRLMLADKLPSDLTVRMALLEEAFNERDAVAARALAREIERAEGEKGPLGLYAHAIVAVLAARAGDKQPLAEARQNLRAAARLRPSWPRPTTLLAEVELLAGNKDQALRESLEALDRGEGRLPAIRRTLQLLFDARRYSEAAALLDKYPNEVKAATRLDRVSAELAFVDDRVEDPAVRKKQALVLARKAVSSDKPTWQDLLWLGQMAWMAGETKEAEKAFTRARDLADKTPAVWVALIQFLARTEPDRAKVEVVEAERRVAPDQVPLVLATCYEAMGELDRSEKEYLRAVSLLKDKAAGLHTMARFYVGNGRAAKAEPFLRKLIDPQTKANDVTAAWARRTLALVLVVGGSYRQFLDAQDLVKERPDESLDDRKARALVLATRSEHRHEAIRLFEVLSSGREAMTPDVKLMLAGLYEADGNWDVAKRHRASLVEDQPKNAPAHAQYIRALLRHKEVGAARLAVERLVALEGAAGEKLELRARVLHAEGKTSEAVKLVVGYAAEKDAHVDAAALLLDEFGAAAEAEQLFRTCAAKEPNKVLLLVQHLGRHGKLGEALALCEKAWDTGPAEQAARVYVLLMHRPEVTPEQRQRAEQLVRTAMEKQPKAPFYPLLLAELQDVAGRRDASLASYRKVLERDPHDIVALNNLAYLQAVTGGDTDESIKLIQAAIDTAGPVPDLLDSRAVIHLKRNRPDLAIRDLQQALAQVSKPSIYFHLAQAQQLAKDRTKAQEAFAKAKELGLKAADLYVLDRSAFTQMLEEFP